MIDLEFWDNFYTDLENGLTKYTRPVDWKQRAKNAENNKRKPLKNQYEGKRSLPHHKGAYHEDY